MIVKNVEKKENNTATFQVETDAAEFEAAVNGAYLKAKNNINIPGFRKGKASRAVVEGMYGAAVFYQDAMDELAPKAFEYGMKESELKIVGSPSIKDVNVSEERTVEYSFEVALFPEVTLGQYKGIEAEKEEKTVTEEEVIAEIDSTRKQNARMISVDDRAAQLGDVTDIDFDGYLDGERFDGGKAEGYSLELGSNSFVPGFEEQLVGMSVGEEKDIDITFPENYAPELAGKAVVFKIKMNGITVADLPELDDEFAKDVSEFDTLEEYKADVSAKLQKRYNDQAEAEFRSEVMRKACDNMTVELPDVMVNDKLEEIIRNYASQFGMNDQSVSVDELKAMMGIDESALEFALRPAAVFQVKSELLVDAVVKAEELSVSEEETEAYLNKVAESINAKPEEVKEYFGLNFIAQEQMKEKATAIIMDSAVAVAKSAAPEAAPVEAEAE